MSSWIYLQAFKGGEPVRFERAVAEKLFAPYVHDLSGDEWSIHWPDGGACFVRIHIKDEPMVRGFSIERPPAFVEFWNAMGQLMKQTDAMLLWGGEPMGCVADAATLGELPDGFVEAEGPIPVISSGQEMWEVYRTS